MSDPTYCPTLQSALDGALRYLGQLDEGRVSASVTLEELRQRLDRALCAEPTDPKQVIEELLRDVEGGLIGSAGGRFYAWVIGGALPAALAADWLTSTWDQNASLYASGPAAAVVEEVAGKWLKDLLHIPDYASFAFVTGCQMAHITCLSAARYQLLRDQGWDVRKRGLSGAPAIPIVASNWHGSAERAIEFLGFGRDNVAELPLDGAEQSSAEDLEAALKAAGRPAIVILQAGDINTGSFDRYGDLIPIAHRHSAWVHVDGAFGLWAAASPRFRHLLDGFEGADSWATDGHKWLNVPYDSGFAFVAHPEAHRGIVSHRASYLMHDAMARDQMDWTPEWSRRARGFATYAAIRELGRKGIADMIEGCCDRASDIVEGLGRLPGVEVLWKPILNQGLVRFTKPGATEGETDRYNDEVLARVLADGRAFFTGTTWHGRRAMRISVVNWRTNHKDVETAIKCVADCLANVSG